MDALQQNWQDSFTHCEYSTRLINKLTHLNNNTTRQKVDITAINKAIYYARKYHGEQKRQSGEPFYSHPLEVAYMVADYLFTTDAIIISILHDTIEDTDLTEEEISMLFNAKVAKQVESLTRIKKGVKITSSELIKQLRSEKNYESLLIKTLDRLHNMQTIGAKSPEKQKKIVEETIQNFLTISAYLDCPIIEEELYNLCFFILSQQSKTKKKVITTFCVHTSLLPLLDSESAELLE